MILLIKGRGLQLNGLNAKYFVNFSKVWKGNVDAQLLLLYLNSKCETFRMLDGNLLAQGKRRLDILANLYRLPRIAFPGVAAQCDRIKMPSKGEFLHEYLFRSKPVIIEGGFLSYCNLSNVLIYTYFYLKTKFSTLPLQRRQNFFPWGKILLTCLEKGSIGF
jgi:hypothetical protein